MKDNVENKRAVLYNEAVTLTNYGKYNLYVLLASGGCLMCVIIETMCMSFIIPAAQCDLNLSLAQKGIMASIAFLGVFCSSHSWGFIADTRGRRNVLVVSLVVSSVLSFVCSVTPWAPMFIFLRFLNGAFIGGSSSIIYAFAGEFHNDKYRPMVISWISSFVAAGLMFIPGMAWVILPQTWSYDMPLLGIIFRPWRLLVIIYALPSLLIAVLLFILPESPKFLLSQGQHAETLEILSKMFQVNTGKQKELYPVSEVILDEIPAGNNEKVDNILLLIWRQTVPLFYREHRVKTALISYLQFGVFMSSSALQLWFPEILNSLTRYSEIVSNENVQFCKSVKYSSETDKEIFDFFDVNSTYVLDESECKDTVNSDVYLVILIIGAGIGVSYIVIGVIINHIGKKQLLIGMAAITAVCGLTAQYIYGYTTILALTGIFLLIASCIGVTNAFVVDLYPTNIRAMALAISLMFGRVGAAVGSNVIGVMFYNYCDYMFVMFAVNHVLVIICAILLPKPKKLPANLQSIK